MKKIFKNFILTRFSFGATSALITNIGLIVGFDYTKNPKISIIGGILVIAIADNISDTLGIHIYQESANHNIKEVAISTYMNYISRFLVSIIFVVIVYVFPIKIAIILSLIYGLSVLSVISYIIAKNMTKKPLRMVLKHLSIALLVIILSNYLGKYILKKF